MHHGSIAAERGRETNVAQNPGYPGSTEPQVAAEPGLEQPKSLSLLALKYKDVVFPTILAAVIVFLVFSIIGLSSITYSSLRGFTLTPCMPIIHAIGQFDFSFANAGLFYSRPPAPAMWKCLAPSVFFHLLDFVLCLTPYLAMLPVVVLVNGIVDEACGFYAKRNGVDVWVQKFASFNMIWSNATAIALNMGVLFAYPMVVQMAPELAGTIMSMSNALVTVLANLGTSLRLQRDVDKMNLSVDQVNARLVSAANIGWINVGVSDGFKAAALVGAAFVMPNDNAWIQTLVVSLVLGVMDRTGWTMHVCYKVTKKTAFLPNVMAILVQDIKYTSSFPKYACFTILLAYRFFMMQLLPDRVVQPVHGNLTIVVVVFSSMLASFAEDALVFACGKCGQVPALDGAAKLFYQNALNEDKRIPHRIYGFDGSEVRHNVARMEQPKNMLIFHVICCPVTMIPGAVLICLLSLETLSGLASDAVPDGQFVLYWIPGFTL